VGTHAAYERRPVPDDIPDGTVSRDRLGTRTVQDAEPSPAAATGRNPAVTFAALAVAAVAVVALVSFVFGGNGDDSETPPTTVASNSGDVALDNPNQPTLHAAPVAGGVAFTWNYLAPEKADQFFVRTAADTTALAQSTDQAPLKQATYTAKAKAGTQVCAQVKVSREGLASDYSTPACGRAQ
jgi:hypothetical protein